MWVAARLDGFPLSASFKYGIADSRESAALSPLKAVFLKNNSTRTDASSSSSPKVSARICKVLLNAVQLIAQS